MCKANLVFGIDVGTTTTAAAYFNSNQKIIASQSIHGETIVPSVFTTEEGEKVSNFKIRFWHTDSPSKKNTSQLSNWIHYLKNALYSTYENRFDDHIYCFTYPAQRQSVLAKYQNLIKDSGFPVSKKTSRPLVVEEPVAAALSYLSESKKEPGLGIVLDIGGGTTDISIVEVQGENQVHIHDASSIDIAGNICSQSMKDLIVEPDMQNIFNDLFRRDQIMIDNIKEIFSDYYLEEENRLEPFSYTCKGIKFRTTFDEFTAIVKPLWNEIDSLITQRLKNKEIRKDEISFVYGVGGGVLHNGLWSLVKGNYGNNAFRSNEPRHAVAKGAALHAAVTTSKVGTTKKATSNKEQVNITYQIGKKIKVVFPDDTEQKTVTIFTKNSRFDLGQSASGSIPICLESNFFVPEGEAFIEVDNHENISLGDIDINWSDSEESCNHGGDVRWNFFPDEGLLTVSISLNNTKINMESYSIIGEATLSLSPSGEYKRTQANMR